MLNETKAMIKTVHSLVCYLVTRGWITEDGSLKLFFPSVRQCGTEERETRSETTSQLCAANIPLTF